MINEDEVIEDNIDDDVGKLLRLLRREESWTPTKHQLKQDLIKLLEQKKYIYFGGHAHRYQVGWIGGSYLYQVPLNRRGHLKRFRGECVRIICVGTGRYNDREFMAGVPLLLPEQAPEPTVKNDGTP